MKKKYILFGMTAIASLIFLDYINLPSLLGFEISNLKLDFWFGTVNIVVILALYVITYKKLDNKTISREKNKFEISILLMQECYRECMRYVGYLSQETVEKYIVPKTDFNDTNNKNSIIDNIQNSPYINESNIMDLVKDGQITKAQIEGYFRVKESYRKYISMRIIFFDAPHIYEPLKTDLINVINNETSILPD